MRAAVLFGGTLLVLGLACGGGGAGGLVGPSLGDFATRYVAQAEKDNPEVPCPGYALGDEVAIGDFTFVFEEANLADGESSLPWIMNHEERSAFGKAGRRALVLKWKIRNEGVKKKRRDVWFTVWTPDGERAIDGSYNAKIYAAGDEGRSYEPDVGGLPPGQWTSIVDVYALDPAAADGAVVYLKRMETRRTERGKKYEVLVDHAVVDLGTPGEEPHVNPEKR